MYQNPWDDPSLKLGPDGQPIDPNAGGPMPSGGDYSQPIGGRIWGDGQGPIAGLPGGMTGQETSAQWAAGTPATLGATGAPAPAGGTPSAAGPWGAGVQPVRDPTTGLWSIPGGPSGLSIGQLAAGSTATAGFPEQFVAPTADQALADPGLQARLKLGSTALLYDKAASGLTNDTGTMNALQDYGQGLAAQGYGDVYSREWQQYLEDYGIFTNTQDRGFDKQLRLATA